MNTCHVMTCTESIPRPRRRLRILIIVRGISYDESYRKFANNFERTHMRLFYLLVVPWQVRRYTVDVGISTYNSSKLPAVMEAYSPVFSHVHNGSYAAEGRTKIHSVLEGLQAAQQHGGASRWDFIVVTRFDISLRRRITDFAVDYRKLNFPWKEKNRNVVRWAELPRVGDALFMFPSKYLSPVITALSEMLEKSLSSRDPSHNSCHRILSFLPQVDREKEVNFLMQGHCISMWNRPNALYREAVAVGTKAPALPRWARWACGGSTEDLPADVLREVNVTVRVQGSDKYKTITQYALGAPQTGLFK